MPKGFVLKNFSYIPDYELPYHRNLEKNLNKIIFSISGGIGDRIVCEPLLRFFIKNYPEYQYEIVSQNPSFFSHLGVKNLSPNDNYDYESGVVFTNFLKPDSIYGQFFNPNNINHLDYIHLLTVGATLPNNFDKIIYLPHIKNIETAKAKFNLDKYNVLQFSATEPNRTLPLQFFEKLDDLIGKKSNQTFVLIGTTLSNNSVNSSTYDFKSKNVLNLLNKTTIDEAIEIILGAEKIITNDSYPIHAGSAFGSSAHIIYCSFLKDNNYLGHWRCRQTQSLNIEDIKEEDLEFGWKQVNIVKNPVKLQYFNPIDRFYGESYYLTDRQKIDLIDFELLEQLLYA